MPSLPRKKAKRSPEQLKNQRIRHAANKQVIEDARQDQEAIIQEATKKTGRSDKFVRRQIIGSITHTCRQSAWNAFMSAKLEALNQSLPPGNQVSMRNLPPEHMARWKKEYQCLRLDEVEHLREIVPNLKIAKRKTVKTSANSHAQDAVSTLKLVCDMLHGLHQRTGVEFVLITTRGSIADKGRTHNAYTLKTDRFIENRFKMSTSELTERMEGYITSGVADDPTGTRSTQKEPRNALVATARDMIMIGYNKLLAELDRDGYNRQDPHITPAYKNYKHEVVERFSVRLEGFPGDVRNPSKIHGGMPPLQHLIADLESGECKWVALSDDEWQEHCESIGYTGVRTKQTKGKKRKSKPDINSSGDEGETQDPPTTAQGSAHLDNPAPPSNTSDHESMAPNPSNTQPPPTVPDPADHDNNPHLPSSPPDSPRQPQPGLRPHSPPNEDLDYNAQFQAMERDPQRRAQFVAMMAVDLAPGPVSFSLHTDGFLPSTVTSFAVNRYDGWQGSYLAPQPPIATPMTPSATQGAQGWPQLHPPYQQ